MLILRNYAPTVHEVSLRVEALGVPMASLALVRRVSYTNMGLKFIHLGLGTFRGTLIGTL
jgi:hypothetical protein